MSGERTLGKILGDERLIHRALREEGDLLADLQKEIFGLFEDLSTTLVTHERYLASQSYTPSQIVTLLNKLRQIAKAFDDMQTAARKVNTLAVTDTRMEDRSMLALCAYLEKVIKGMNDLIKDLEANRVSFAQGRKFQSSEDVIHTLNLILADAKKGTDRVLRERFYFMTHKFQNAA